MQLDGIRVLTRDDVRDQLAIQQFAFQFDMAETDLDEAIATSKPEQSYGYFIDDELASTLTVIPLTTYVNGVVMKMGGVAGVASWPEHRRRGMVAGLLQHALTAMKDHQQVVSMLAPFSFAFYRRYGWEHCIDRKSYRLDRADWPRYPETDGMVRRTTGFEDIATIYEAYATRFTGTLERTEAWWQQKIKRLKSAVIAVYREAGGKGRGYVIYSVRNSELTIHEFVHLDEDARRGLWNFLHNHDSMAGKATVIAPVTDNLPFLVDNPRIQQEIIPYFMARIVLVEEFLRLYRFCPDGIGQTLRVRVSDPNAPWNEGVFVVTLGADGGQDVYTARTAVDGASVERAGVHGATGRDRTHGSSGDEVSCDIQTLTAMMLGYQRPFTLAHSGRLKGTPEAAGAWERAIPQQTTFLYDFF